MNIYVGNLSWNTTDEQLRTAFSAYGAVKSASVMRDKATGRSRGFGFVEMAKTEEAKAAIAALNGVEMDGRNLTVNEAKPKEDKGGYPKKNNYNRGGGSSGGRQERRKSDW